MKNADKPINPTIDKNIRYHGLTKREYFAGLAMQGILANPSTNSARNVIIADVAITCADELLKQLEHEKD